MSENILQIRYLSKLLANIISIVINILITMLIPRALGPAAFGNFEFLTNYFTRIINLLNMRTIIAFYTKLSQRPREFGLVSFYLTLSGLMAGILFLFVAVSNLLNIYTYLWPDQDLLYIYLGALWGALTIFFQVINKMADAYGLTVNAEVLRVILKVLGLGLILFLYFSGNLNLITLFIYHYILILFFCIALVWFFSKKGYSLFKNWQITLKQNKKYAQEFIDYCHPLITYTIVGFIVGILDMWLLQYFAGSIQQGFFGLGFKIGTICFLFTSAMTPLIHREYAIAFEKNDLKEIARLFRRYIPLLYAMAAYLSCFILMQVKTVTYIFGGEKFDSAIVVISILALYPMHQTYGQLSGTVFYATGQTKLIRNINILFLLLGLPLTYIFLSHSNHFGLNLGAVGLALKMVLIQFLAVNVQLFFNTRMLKLNYFHYLGHQIVCVVSLASIAYCTSYIIDAIMTPSSIIKNFILSGVIYTIFVMITVWKIPVLFGLQSTDINRLLELIQKRLFNK